MDFADALDHEVRPPQRQDKSQAAREEQAGAERSPKSDSAERSEPQFFHLFSIVDVFFRQTPLFRPLLTILETLDDMLLRVPGVKLMAWQVIFELSGPRKH